MNRTAVLVWSLAVLMVLVVPATAAGATWTQAGYDAGRTGTIPFQGPQTNDTAFQVQLPGTPVGPAMMDGGDAYVVTRDLTGFFDGPTEGLEEEALWRIDLATGQVERVFDLLSGSHEALAPGQAVLQDGEDLVAVEIPSGEEIWRSQVREDDPEVALRDYAGAVAVEARLYVIFLTWRGTTDPYFSDPPVPGVMALDLKTGEIAWDTDRMAWQTGLTDGAGERLTDPQWQPYGGAFRLAADAERVYAYGQLKMDAGITVDGQPAIPVRESVTDTERIQYELWALRGEDGQALWTRNDTGRTEAHVAGVTPPGAEFQGQLCCGFPVVTETAVHIRMDAFEAFNKATGERVWVPPSPAGRTDQLQILGTSGMGVRGDAVVATSEQSVYRLERTTGGLDWQKSELDGGRSYSVFPLMVDQDTIYAETFGNFCGFGVPGIEARDLATGELLWEWSYEPRVGVEGCSASFSDAVAMGPGILVKGAKDGTVTVIGKTQASLGAPELKTEQYPGPGEEVSLDLSDTEPGAFGPATRYMVDWGDGTVSGWQEDPGFTHVYEEEGEVTARAIAGNEANQTSSTFVTMHVGASEPNLVETAFARENQDLTFGILGILVAVTGGAIGVTRRYRKRSRLERELEALETGFQETRDRPGTCEALLETRQARARSLVLDGVLDEQQAAMVESRAEELKRRLRTYSLQEEFGFLPYSLVRKAQEMLEDGRVTSLEREAFLSALEEDEVLTDEQRALVRERIEGWFARDAGGGGGGP